ncbi:MAG: OB-fold domain-containing protein [Spongiibacteraceae bacterium]
MSDVRPPQPGALDQPFWDGLNQQQFLLHRCGICGCHYWPASCCVAHGAAAMAWVPTSGCGEVHTYTIFHRAYTTDMADQVPYTVCVVKLDEGPFFHARLQSGLTPCRGLRVCVDLGAPVIDGVPPPFQIARQLPEK